MVLFKVCPRCGGDVSDDRDIHGPFMACVQCGYTADGTPGTSLTRKPSPPDVSDREWVRMGKPERHDRRRKG